MTEVVRRPVSDPEFRAQVTERLRGIQEALISLSAELHAVMASMAQCDGERDGEPCILAWHSGPHRSASGHQWLDG